jgi:hypothetical protein
LLLLLLLLILFDFGVSRAASWFYAETEADLEQRKKERTPRTQNCCVADTEQFEAPPPFEEVRCTENKDREQSISRQLQLPRFETLLHGLHPPTPT